MVTCTCMASQHMYHDLRTTGIKRSGFKVLERREKKTEDLLVG